MTRDAGMKALLLAALFVAGPVHAQAPEGSAHVDPGKLLAKVFRVVPPEYPRSAIERRVQGVVDVEGVVRPSGALADPRFSADSPEATIFIPAVQDVIGYWLFEPAIGEDCQPAGGPLRTRVHFEMDGEIPRIFVTHRKADTAVARASHDAGEYATLRRVSPQYPTRMVSMDIEANVYALLTILPNGEVGDVLAKAHVVLPHYDQHVGARWHVEQLLERQRNADLTAFERAAVRAFKGWQYKPVNRQTPRLACVDIHFRIRR